MTTVQSTIKLAEQERIRHINKIISIIAKAKILRFEGKITKEEYDQIANSTGYHSLLNSEVAKYTENILYYRYRLIDLYSRVIAIYKQYKTGFKSSDTFPDLEQESIEFYKFMNCYDLYETMKRKNMIIKDKNAKKSTCLDAGKLSYIFLLEPYTSRIKTPIITTVHEMGHAYYNRVLVNAKKEVFARGLPIEIMSYCFEKFFFDFLRDNSNIESATIDQLIKNKETLVYRLATEYKKGLEAFDIPTSNFELKGVTLKYEDKKGPKTHDLSDQPYIIGNLASAKLFAEYQKDKGYFIKQLPSIIKEINEKSFEDILNEYSDTKPFQDYLDQHLVLRPIKK